MFEWLGGPSKTFPEVVLRYRLVYLKSEIFRLFRCIYRTLCSFLSRQNDLLQAVGVNHLKANNEDRETGHLASHGRWERCHRCKQLP